MSITIIDKFARKDDVAGEHRKPICGIDQVEGLEDVLANAGTNNNNGTNQEITDAVAAANNYAASAYNSANAANTSAGNAGNAANAANNSAGNASNSATSASNSATSAGNSATSAGNSATSAGNSATSAGNSATSAGNSASSAATAQAAAERAAAQIAATPTPDNTNLLADANGSKSTVTKNAQNVASGAYSQAFGYGHNIIGQYSLSGGMYNVAYGNYTLTAGRYSVANNDYSAAIGNGGNAFRNELGIGGGVLRYNATQFIGQSQILSTLTAYKRYEPTGNYATLNTGQFRSDGVTEAGNPIYYAAGLVVPERSTVMVDIDIVVTADARALGASGARLAVFNPVKVIADYATGVCFVNGLDYTGKVFSIQPAFKNNVAQFYPSLQIQFVGNQIQLFLKDDAEGGGNTRSSPWYATARINGIRNYSSVPGTQIS